MACGKTVAKPPPATPCSASDQMLYSGTFSRGMARVRLTSCDAFSSSVMRETRSSTRLSIGQRRVLEREGRLLGVEPGRRARERGEENGESARSRK